MHWGLMAWVSPMPLCCSLASRQKRILPEVSRAPFVNQLSIWSYRQEEQGTRPLGHPSGALVPCSLYLGNGNRGSSKSFTIMTLVWLGSLSTKTSPQSTHSQAILNKVGLNCFRCYLYQCREYILSSVPS